MAFGYIPCAVCSLRQGVLHKSLGHRQPVQGSVARYYLTRSGGAYILPPTDTPEGFRSSLSIALRGQAWISAHRARNHFCQSLHCLFSQSRGFATRVQLRQGLGVLLLPFMVYPPLVAIPSYTAAISRFIGYFSVT